MAISQLDVKKLWGLSAGRCNFPGCSIECIPTLQGDATILGEMAHVIARQSGGPRGTQTASNDSYENLILLCPNHHTEIDKAPSGTYTAEAILGWKHEHEKRIAESLSSPIFDSRMELAKYIQRLLIENRTIWSTFGPESSTAQSNPLSNAVDIWVLRKLDTLIPNNRRVILAIKNSRMLWETDDYEIACMFIEHAEAFERNCYERTENVPRFPTTFTGVLEAYASKE